MTTRTNDDKTVYAVDLNCFKEFNAALAEDSDRARVIVAAAWIDKFLEAKLRAEFSKGNAKAREALFSDNGPLSFSAKLNIAFCAGWIDRDVYNDATVIRKLRNKSAHTAEPVSLDDPKTRNLIESLRVPNRQFSDWGDLRAAATGDDLVIYTGDMPENATEDLYIPGLLTFRLAIPLILAVLVSNLGIVFRTDEDDRLYQIKLPKHMGGGE